MGMWLIQSASAEGYDCKTIIGVLAGAVGAMAIFIVKQFLSRIKDLKDANSLATTLLQVGDQETRRRRGGGKP